MATERFFSIDTPTKKAYLRRAYNCSISQQIALVTALESFQDKSLDLVEGSALKASASNGHSAMAFDPGLGSPAGAEFATMWGELIELYERAKSYLICPPTVSLNGIVPTPIPDPTDAQIYSLMNHWLVPVRETQNDYTWGRIVPGFDYVQ